MAPDEKALYPLVAYGMLWPVLLFAGQRLLSPAAGSAAAGFVWALGFWAVAHFVLGRRTPLLRWLAICVAFAAVAFFVPIAVDRLMSAV